MICSNCNENVAVVFINKIEDGKNITEGLCYKCAKEISKANNIKGDKKKNQPTQLRRFYDELVLYSIWSCEIR